MIWAMQPESGVNITQTAKHSMPLRVHLTKSIFKCAPAAFKDASERTDELE